MKAIHEITIREPCHVSILSTVRRYKYKVTGALDEAEATRYARKRHELLKSQGRIE